MFLAAMVGCGLLGVVIERFAYRPLRNAPRIAPLITALGVSFFLQASGQLLFGAEIRSYDTYSLGNFVLFTKGIHWKVFGIGIDISRVRIVVILSAVFLMAGLTLFVGRSQIGKAMRATSYDREAAAMMGINVDRVIVATFFIGSALAGAAGVMAGGYYGKIDFLMGFIIGLKAFTAAVIGGIGNIPGTMLGGLLLGLLESFGTHFVGGQWRDVFAFGFLILFLTVRPTGLLGERVTERV
jgi:branched-chain amino acid transport system permease protein